MKLLIVTQLVDKDDPILGFFHRWLLEFAAHFDHVDVIALRKGAYDLPPNVTVHSLGKEDGESDLKYVIRFYHYMWKLYVTSHVDFVFFHMGAIFNILGAPFFLIRKFRHTKFLWWKTHGKLDGRGKLALRFVDEVVTAGSKSFAGDRKKVRVIGHAIDTDRFKDGDTDERVLATARMVGRVTPIKKIEYMIPVVATLVETTPDFKLSLIGTCDEPHYMDTLKKSIAGSHLERSIEFSGSRTQVELVAEYHRAGFLFHPAYEAGFDKVVAEAMASGVIPLTSIPSFEPILGSFGLYIEKGDTDAYSRRVLELMKMNEDELKELRSKLRHIVTSQHSISTLSERIFGVNSPVS